MIQPIRSFVCTLIVKAPVQLCAVRSDFPMTTDIDFHTGRWLQDNVCCGPF